jgi:deoxyadenosine/deoxycytidine kinase
MTAFRVHVEGNIACGKTTLLRNFEQIRDFTTVLETVDEWQTVGFREFSPNLLKKFYADPVRYAEIFQQVVMQSYIPLHDFDAPTAIKVMERSLHSSVIFRHVLLKKHILSEQQDEELHAQYRRFCTPKTDADLILYLRTNPRSCFNRLNERNREGEEDVSLDYLTHLHTSHEEWVLCSPFRVVTINAEDPIHVVQQKATAAIYRAFAEARIQQYAPPILTGPTITELVNHE